MEKEHITPNGVGRVFYQLLASTESDFAKHYRSQLYGMNVSETLLMNVSETLLIAEIIAIRWLALEFGTTMVLGYGPRRNAVLDSLTYCLHENVSPELGSFLDQRVGQYAVNMKTSNPGSIDYATRIGERLAMLIFERADGSESDVNTIQCIGAIEFKAMFDEAENIFEEKTPFTIDW